MRWYNFIKLNEKCHLTRNFIITAELYFVFRWWIDTELFFWHSYLYYCRYQSLRLVIYINRTYWKLVNIISPNILYTPIMTNFRNEPSIDGVNELMTQLVKVKEQYNLYDSLLLYSCIISNHTSHLILSDMNSYNFPAE